MTTNVEKIDSDVTGLSYAEEESLGVLPVTPVWYPLEPNEYKDFGGDITTKARTPISASRQRKKGVVVDLESAGGFSMDITQTNLQSLMQGFMFASFRTKSEKAVSAAVGGATDTYTIVSGGGALGSFHQNDLVFAKDMDTTANNGLKIVAALAGIGATAVKVTTDLTAETGQAGTLSRVGVMFPAGTLSADVLVSTYPAIVSAVAAAVGTLTLAGNPSDGDTVTIGDVVYSFETGAIDAAYKVDVGADAAGSVVNLVKAINLTGTAGTDYGVGTLINPYVTAADGTGDTVDVTAKVKGIGGNAIATTEAGSNTSWGATTLTGGTGRALNDLGLIPGEWVYVGGDGAGVNFATAAIAGRARIRTIAEGRIDFDKTDTDWGVVDDNGAGKTVQLFFGRVLKNEALRANQVARSYQLERTLGAPDTGNPTSDQSEYIVGSTPDEFTIGWKTADKLEAELNFMGTDHETRTEVEGIKSGTRAALEESDGFNTSSDVPRIALTVVSATDSQATPLFARISELNLTIKNNLSMNKSIGTLGAFAVTAGYFEVTAEMEAYFADVLGVRAVRTNEDVSLDVHLYKDNAGMAFDMPLLALGKGRADVKQNEAIKLPLSGDGSTGRKISTDLDHTLLICFYDYLPDAAAA